MKNERVARLFLRERGVNLVELTETSMTFYGYDGQYIKKTVYGETFGQLLDHADIFLSGWWADFDGLEWVNCGVVGPTSLETPSFAFICAACGFRKVQTESPTEKCPSCEAKRILEEGYYQVSRQHRNVACFPLDLVLRYDEASVPFFALNRHDHELAGRLTDPFHVGDQYLRCYAEKDGNEMTLTREVFDEFRRLGGTTYRGPKKGSNHEKEEREKNSLTFDTPSP